MKDCIFCKIVTGEIPSAKVYENKDFFGFLDITPVSIGHTLVIPKKHSRNIFDIDDETLKGLAPILKKISIAIKNAIRADGININMNNEPSAGQVVFHTHVHIIPRFEEDGLKMWHGKKQNETKLKKTADKIITEL